MGPLPWAATRGARFDAVRVGADAAYLAEYLLEHQQGEVRTKVVGVPGSIDGDGVCCVLCVVCCVLCV
jgi:hypothetical protein